MGVWLAIGVVAMALGLALTDGESGLRTWLALRGDLRTAQGRIERLRTDVAELEREGGGLTGAGEPFALERAIRERLIQGPGDFRGLFVLSEVGRRLDVAIDSLVRCGHLVHDYVLHIVPGA